MGENFLISVTSYFVITLKIELKKQEKSKVVEPLFAVVIERVRWT